VQLPLEQVRLVQQSLVVLQVTPAAPQLALQ
jgi:hypothetical protein